MESQTKAIQYDLTHLRQEFIAILNDFSNGVQSEKIGNTLGKRLLKHLQNQANQILTRLETDFSLVVIGDFKRGKSTLINALLGKPVVTTDVTTETVTINYIQYGSTQAIYACLTDGGQVKLETEELKVERLTPILEQLPQTVSHLSIETPVEWLRGLRLVDTPGTGDILKRFDRQVHDYLVQADAVIFVGSALAPLGEAERMFLQRSVLPQDFPKVFFVLNMMDSIRTAQEAERLLKATYKKISRSFPNAQFFGLSALDEFCRLQSLPRPNPDQALKLAAAFNDFREYLQESIHLNRDLIQLNRAADLMTKMLQEFEESLERLRNALQTDQSLLSRAIAQCEDENSELFSKIAEHKVVMKNEISQMREQACHWMNEFMARLETEAIAAISSFKIDQIRRHFHFFLTNSLRQAFSQSLGVHQPAIIESSQKTQRAIFEELQILTDVSITVTDTKKATLHEHQWTNLDTLDLLADSNPSTFGADLLVKQTKDLIASKEIFIYKQKLQNYLPELKVSVIQKISSLYNSIAAKIERQIESVYQQDIEGSLSAMRQAQVLCSQGSQQVAATNEGLQEASSLLVDTRSCLNSFKQKLYSEDILDGTSKS